MEDCEGNIHYVIAKRVMQLTQKMGTHEMRAIAGAMLSWIDDTLMKVVAEEIGLPAISRAEFEKSLWFLDEERLAKVAIGILMLDGFSDVQRKYLMGEHKITAANARKAQAAI